ncbi:MAG: hypothetical protein RL088_3554 [Verrucomicrobiota bacterium]
MRVGFFAIPPVVKAAKKKLAGTTNREVSQMGNYYSDNATVASRVVQPPPVSKHRTRFQTFNKDHLDLTGDLASRQ